MTAATDRGDTASGSQRRGVARDGWALAFIVVAVLGGGLARALMARGNLWLDEVWSLDLVRPLSSSWGVFTDLSHDNNHFLNSLWLFWLGPDRAPWVYRAPSVVYGMLAVALAGATVWRRSRVGAVVAALFAAFALPLVVYGSEARGYGGLIATILLAIAAFDRALAAPEGSQEARHARLLLGAAIGLGTLFHLTMLATLAALGFAALVHFAANRPLVRAIDAVLALFRPALIGLLPAMAAIVAGLLRRGGFATGGTSPASLDTFGRGYGDLLRFTLGLPAFVPCGLCFTLAGVLALGASRFAAPTPARRALAFAALVACPATMLLLHLPNLEFPRYYLLPGLVLLLLGAEIVGALWDRGTPTTRLLASLLVGLAIAAHGMADVSALRTERGRYGEALVAMAAPQGHVDVATRDEFWIRSVAEAAARRHGLTLTFVPETAFCHQAPEWVIAGPEEAGPAAGGDIVMGPPACAKPYRLWRTVAAGPLSGMPWTLYRAVADR